MQDPNSPQDQPSFVTVAQPLQYMTATANPYSGRKTGLMVFGVLMLIAAAFCVLVTLAFIASLTLMGRQVGFTMPLYVVVQTLTVYAAASIGLACLGVGSIRAKRWVRPVVVPLSAVALVGAGIGLVGAIGPMLSLPNTGGPAVVGIFVGIFILLIFCAAPAAVLWFYGSARTRDALWFYDPNPSWAEVVPMPVFAISLLSALGALSLVATLLVPINPTFGVLLRGPLATLATAITLAALVAVSVLCFRRSMLGWWLAMAVTVLGLASNAANLATGATRELAVEMIDEMYGSGPNTASGAVVIQGTSGGGFNGNGQPVFPATLPTTAPVVVPPPITTAQIQAQMRQSMREQAGMQSAIQMVGVVAMGAVICGYLLWARKYFSPTAGT